MHQRGLVGAKLYLAGLGFPDRRSHVEGHGSGLRVGHQPARAKHLTQAAHRLHHVGRGNHGVEVRPVFFLDLLHHLFAAHDVGARRFGFAHLFATGDDQDLLGFAQPMRQDHSAADHLVGMLGIDSQAHGQVHCLVKLGVLHFLQKRHRVLKRVRTSFDGGARLPDVLSGFSHCSPRLPPPSLAAGGPWYLRLRPGGRR